MTSWQQRAASFARQHNMIHDPATHALDLVTEIGEVVKEVLLATDYGQGSLQFRSELSNELGDALYSLLVLADVCGVDIENALNTALKKYQRRLIERGQAGSRSTESSLYDEQ